MASGTKRIPRAIREQQMLDSAINVFADLGYRSASMDSIARGAEISKPMLYLYYGSKEDLFAACVERESGRLTRQLQDAGEVDENPKRRVENVVRAFLDFVDSNAASWKVVYRQAVAEPLFRDNVEETRRVIVGLVTDLLAESTREARDRDSLEVVATALVGAGEAVADRVAGGAIGSDNAAAVVVDLAWQGLSGARRASENN